MKFFKFKKITKTEVPVVIGSRSVWRRIGKDSHVDWAIIVGISFIIMLTLIFLSLSKYRYFDVSLKNRISTTKPQDSSMVDTQTLDGVLKVFEEKANIRAGLLKGYNGPGDPSI
ncbi:MAG: hypothetical protein WCS89_03570 [Candidatus Paceibacterota bacterium]